MKTFLTGVAEVFAALCAVVAVDSEVVADSSIFVMVVY